jgi:hypothetical protein
MAISRQARPIYVSLPAAGLSLEQTQKVIAEIMTAAGHPGCFSGRDFNFVNEIDYFVTAEAAVRPAQEVQLR